MKKATKVILAILGGINTVMYIFTPIILVILWITIVELSVFSSWFMYFIGAFSTLFRAIKVGGFIDDENLINRLIRKKNGKKER